MIEAFGRIRSGRLALATAALALVLLAGPAAGQAPTPDARWLPWLGCWTEVGSPADAPMLCVVPEGEGVGVLSVGRAGPTERWARVADGEERPVAASGCAGTEAIAFSEDERRVYLRTRQTCEGGVERSTRSLMAMVGADQWIYARAMEVDGRSVVRVQRYRPAPVTRIEAAGLEETLEAVEARAGAVEAARLAASSPIGVDALIEAHARTDPEAVRAWIAERGEPMELDADALIRLADAGVAPEVIDVAIAVSFPERFRLAHQPHAAATAPTYGGTRGMYSSWGRFGFLDPFYFDSFYYSPYYYDLRYRYGYGYGYGYWSPYRNGYGTVIVVRPSDGSASGGQGRVIRGRGYTRTPAGESVARPGLRAGSPPRATTGSRQPASRPSKGKAKPRKKSGG